MPSVELMHCIDGFEAQQKMPRGHGRVGSNIGNVAGRRNHSLCRRSLDESNYKLISEERQISALILGNTEQRCVIFTLVSPELDAYFKLATILQALQIPEQRNHSATPPESPPAIIFLVNLQKEHSTALSENTCPSESSSPCSSSEMNIMESRNRNKRTKSLKDSSNSSGPRCLTADTSSGSPCDSLTPPSSDDLVSDISKVEQPRKKGSKKKGKKKGKHYKRSVAKEDSTELEGHCEQSTFSTPIVETSMGCPPACLAKKISEKSSEKLSFSPTSLVENNIIVKDDSETNNYADSSTTMMSNMSNNDRMEESEAMDSQSQAMDSQSQEFAHEKFTSHSLRELKSTSSGTKSIERVPSPVYVNIKSAIPNQSFDYNYKSSRTSMALFDDAVAGSFQDHRESDVNGNHSNDVETQLPIKDKEGLDISGELDSDSKKFEVNLDLWKCDPSFHRNTGNSLIINNEVSNDCSTSSSFWSEGVVVHADSSTERAQCSSEACSSNDFRPVISGKRGRVARKSTARTGKGLGKDDHPVWQKVQKMENRRHINKPVNVDAVSPIADNLSEDSNARARVNASSGLSQTSKRLYSYETVSETSKSSEINTKKKHGSISKQVNHHPRKGYHNGTVHPGRPSKIHVQQNEGLKILPQVNHDGHTSSQLSSPSSDDSPIPVVNSTEKFDLLPSLQQQKAKEHINEESLSRNTGNMAGEMTSSVACYQIGESFLTVDSSVRSHEIDVDGHAFQGYVDMQDDLVSMDSRENHYKKLHEECFHSENSEPHNNSAVLQKWAPVGRKDAVVSQTAHAENLTASVIDDSISNVVDSKYAEIEVGSGAQSIVPLTGLEMQGSSRSGDDADCSSSETDIPNDKLVSCSHADGGFVVHNELNLQLLQDDQQFVNFETDLDKIMHAASDAYRLQNTAAVPLLAGSPLAEVERFMCSASPVISLRNHDRIFTSCSGEQLNSKSLYVGQIHNLSLASLWRWYEEPGCYGLEVKAEENHKSKGLHDGFVEFKAYFVPYLSAMQLFRRSGSSFASSSGVVTESSEVDEASSTSSKLASLPIFSTLLPRPRAGANACLVESNSSARNEFCNRSTKATNFDEELIFEYFEHAQPSQRRPLFDKIKELINGGRSPNSQIYGDPTKLECLSLRDLHPASWYAVAWYPIYRIPEGNFRAAFLTYHSLGHFIRQSASSNTTGDFARITSPVVGLQSYNAKKECWFQPRALKSTEAQKEESSVSSPSKVLEERLKTLECTASVMATAVVRKGNQRSVNNHPDYNHFSSRW